MIQSASTTTSHTRMHEKKEKEAFLSVQIGCGCLGKRTTGITQLNGHIMYYINTCDSLKFTKTNVSDAIQQFKKKPPLLCVS